jgi:hypothetical protein
MTDILKELAALSAPTLAAVVALAGATGAIIAAAIGRLVVTPFLGARDKQDREVEWRKHALELAKLDLERRLKTYIAGESQPMRPSILDFLANYRDLQELGTKTPRDLFIIIKDKRITRHPPAQAKVSTIRPPDDPTDHS